MSRAVTVLGFAVCAVVFSMLWVWARLRPDRIAGPGELLEVAMSRRSTRVVILVFWWWIGWHFLVEP